MCIFVDKTCIMAKDLNKNGLANITIRNIHPEIKDKFIQIANKREIKMNELGRKLITDFVNRNT